nr:hypothetical protein [Bradyrhizobium ivorense]
MDPALRACCGVPLLSMLVHIGTGPLGHDRKPGPSTDRRAHLNTMAKYTHGLPNDEEPDAETITAHYIDPRKGLEYSRHMLTGNADSSVDNIDPDMIPKVTTAHQEAAAWFGVFDRIADEIAEHRTQQQNVAFDPGAG